MAWRRPKVGRRFRGPSNQRIVTECVITSDVFFSGGRFVNSGAYEGRQDMPWHGAANMTPALQREHYSEQAEARK
eukprot:2039463-Pyramimonas_sp.AAC.1